VAKMPEWNVSIPGARLAETPGAPVQLVAPCLTSKAEKSLPCPDALHLCRMSVFSRLPLVFRS
jgi:hypothetical protein